MIKGRKQLDQLKRAKIEQGLKDGVKQKELAEAVGCDLSTISKEVKAHRKFYEKKGERLSICAHCLNSKECNKKHVCGEQGCSMRCYLCRQIMNEHDCDNYSPIPCKINRYPYVCYNCSHKSICKMPKYYYDAEQSQLEYGNLLVDSRVGIDKTPEGYEALDNIIKKGVIDNKQSIYHVVKANKDKLNISVKTVYNYINGKYLTTTRMDLPNAIRLKKRK